MWDFSGVSHTDSLDTCFHPPAAAAAAGKGPRRIRSHISPGLLCRVCEGCCSHVPRAADRRDRPRREQLLVGRRLLRVPPEPQISTTRKSAQHAPTKTHPGWHIDVGGPNGFASFKALKTSGGLSAFRSFCHVRGVGGSPASGAAAKCWGGAEWPRLGR